MTSQAELAFNDDIIRGLAALQHDIGYQAPRFRQMVADYGPVPTTRRLLDDPANTHEGFERLYFADKLDMTVEFLALLPWYRDLFTAAQLDRARWRLEQHGMDVDARLQRAAANPPAWSRQDFSLRPLTNEDRTRLVNFLSAKMCGPCRRDGATADHAGCVEAEALIGIVQGAT